MQDDGESAPLLPQLVGEGADGPASPDGEIVDLEQIERRIRAIVRIHASQERDEIALADRATDHEPAIVVVRIGRIEWLDGCHVAS